MRLIVLMFLLFASLLYAQSQISAESINGLYLNYLKSIEKPQNDALKKLPEIKNNFIDGKYKSSDLYQVVILRDSIGLWEQVYMLVHSWQGDTVTATLASEMNVVKGYPYGSTFIYTEDKIKDWLLIHSDGKEEGNYIVKYFQSLK